METELKRRRGGARNHKKPEVDEFILFSIFSKHAEELINVGPYEAISKSQAVNAVGLAKNFGLLQALISASPTAEIPAGLAKHAILRMLSEKPELNKSIYNTATYAGLRVDRVSTMLYHVRRLRDDNTRHLSCSAKCTGEDWQKVKQLLLLADQEGGDDDTTTQYVSEEHVGEGSLEQDDPPLKRKLTMQVSLDSEGYPRIFDEPAQTTNKRLTCKQPSPAKVALDADGYPLLDPKSLSAPSCFLQKSLYQTEAGGSQAMATGKVKAKAKGKGKAQAQSGTPPGQVKDWTKMYYKATGSFAIRRKWGKKEQVFQFKCSKGNKLNTKQHSALEMVAKKCIVKLLEGAEELEIAAWSMQQAALI